jgi:hypothetical protein
LPQRRPGQRSQLGPARHFAATTLRQPTERGRAVPGYGFIMTFGYGLQPIAVRITIGSSACTTRSPASSALVHASVAAAGLDADAPGEVDYREKLA